MHSLTFCTSQIDNVGSGKNLELNRLKFGIITIILNNIKINYMNIK